MTEAEQLKLATKKSLQQTHISQESGSGADEGTGILPGVLDVPTEESDEDISWKYSDEGDDGDDDEEESDEQDDDENKDDDDQDEGDNDDQEEEEIKDEESFDPIPKTPENTDDEGNGEENLGLNVGRAEGQDEEDDEDELYRDKIIKEQLKEQVKVQVSKISPKIEQTMNEQLEAKVLTRSSNSSKTSYAVAADLSKMELKKILIKRIKGNKSIHRSNEQRNLYKALVKAYESDKIIG
nr:hypothetical protein [Tanacetum cinerariifolium]